MRVLITFGPTYEPLDEVRRLTNFSTGRLGTELANFFSERGHAVTALRGHSSSYREECRAAEVIEFTTTADLLARLRGEGRASFDAVFHAVAVSDFAFGGVFKKKHDGTLQPITSGKYSTRDGTLLAELVPTPKVIAELRPLFPTAKIFGWKYEVDGTREEALALGKQQIEANSTDYSIVNGPAYGTGFGIVGWRDPIEHCPTLEILAKALLRRVADPDPVGRPF
jgi:phosphopantothenoylcysteine synthetase/decarboxylase